MNNTKEIIKIQSHIRKYLSYRDVNDKRFGVILNKLVDKLSLRICKYHELFSLPLIGEQWEETLHRSFEDIGYSTTWVPNRSHKIGEDMSLKNISKTRISCKSGQLVKNKTLDKNCVKFNGSRTTSYKTLEEKIRHLSKSHDDYYFMLSKTKPFNFRYKLLVFNSSICKVDKLDWCLSKSGKSWNGNGAFIATIGKSMSDQLWTTFPIDKIQYVIDIDCRKI